MLLDDRKDSLDPVELRAVGDVEDWFDRKLLIGRLWILRMMDPHIVHEHWDLLPTVSLGEFLQEHDVFFVRYRPGEDQGILNAFLETDRQNKRLGLVAVGLLRDN